MPQPHVHSAAAHKQARLEFRQKQRAAVLGAVVNLPLAFLKIIAGYYGASQALIADGVDSATDIVCDVLVIGAVRVSDQHADSDHPYGHARIETAATTLISLMLLLTAAAIGYQGIMSLLRIDEGAAPPSLWALVVAALSILVKEGLYWYTLKVGQRARSALMESNAWHHRSDALTSAVALAAIIGAMLGFPMLDALGAIVIAVLIAVIGLRYGWQSYSELVDTGLNPERLHEVQQQITAVPGVRHMRRLRTRTMGGHDAFADVGVFVDPGISLTEAHRISEAITARLLAHVDEIADICVHIEPDGYADSTAAFSLPLREQIRPRLQAAWAHIPPAAAIERMTLHYLEDQIAVELLLPLTYAGGHARWQQQFDGVVAAVDGISSIRLLYG